MRPAPVSLRDYGRLLRQNRNYRLLWAAQMVSEIGDWLYAVAIYSLLLELTGKASSVATAVVLQVLPQVFIAPVAGVVNDRFSRRRVMIFADLARAAIVVTMLLAQSRQSIWLIYLLLFGETLMWGLFEPGRTATIPNLTRGEHETAVANALGSTTWSLNFALGFFAGGLVAAAFGPATVFLLNAGSFLASAALLARMRFAEPHVGEAGSRAGDGAGFASMLEGIRYIAHDRRRLAIMLCKAGLGLLGANWVILPILGERVFPVRVGGIDPARAGMLGMSVLLGSRGLGALMGPLVAGQWAGSHRPHLRKGILVGFGAIGIGYVLLSAAPNVWLACAALVISHAGGSVVWVFSTTLLHYQTEDRFRGRVFSADFSFLTMTMAAASSVAGAAIDRGVPVRQVAMFTGLVAWLPAVLWGLFGLPLWKGESPAPDETPPPAWEEPAAPPSAR